MLADVLNRAFLLDAAAATRRRLVAAADAAERRDQGALLPDVTVEQINEVVAEFRRLSAQLTEGEDHPVSVSPAAAKDDYVFMPREPLLAILQTVLQEVVEQHLAGSTTPGPPEDERRSGGGQAVVSAQHLSVPPSASRFGQGTDQRRAFGPFEVTDPKIFSDPRWVLSGVVIAWHKFKKKAQFGGLPDAAVQIADDARILLVGDWGSGTERARKVAAQMRRELDVGVAKGQEQHVIHLGDVYYTGSEKEYERHFLANWPVRPDEGISSYNLAGNHDMYQGGHAYYERCLRGDARFRGQAGRSVFLLRNSAWQFLALDSSYEDQALYGGQADWVAQQLESNAGLRAALLSHHQLFSAYEDGAGRMREQLEAVLHSGRIDAWFWAHEHRCLTYGSHDRVGFSSCLGHGGIPEYLVNSDANQESVPLRYEYRREFGAGVEPWNTFGFAVVELDGRAMHVRYVDEEGVTHHEEHLAA